MNSSPVPGPLPQPHTEAGRAGLAALLDDPGRALIAFDFDGTISPIVDDPDRAYPVAGATATLRRLAATIGTVAVITGRPADVVVRLGSLTEVPGILVNGAYGAETWQDGRLEVPAPPPGLNRAGDDLAGLLYGTDPGVWIEDKRLALVVHTRRAADPQGTLEELTEPVKRIADAAGLELHHGRLVLELRLPGYDKGGTLRRLVEQVRPGAVLFAGDDVGDLPAFDAVAELRADGIPGLSVASESPEAPRVAAAADLVVPGPAGVVALFGAIADAAAH